MTIYPNKVRIYPFDNETVELANGKSVTITRQKTDSIFPIFNSDSKSAALCKKIAEDPDLRTFFFLQSELRPNLSKAYPVSQLTHFMLSSTGPISASFTKDYKSQIDEISDKLKESGKNAQDALLTYNYETIGAIYSDPNFLSSIRRRKSDEIKKNFERSIERHKEEIMKGFSKVIDKLSEVPDYLGYERDIKELLDQIEKAIDNTKVLEKTEVTLTGTKRLESAMNSLSAENCRLSLITRCLECVFKYKDDSPFHSEVLNPKDVNILLNCPRCKGPGLIYTIEVGFPAGISQLIMPDTNWLPEVVIGYALSSLSEVEKVFVHKIIHNNERGKGTGTGAECDVIVITTDKRLFLVEVSTSQKIENIQEMAHKKVENFKQKNIKFDGFAYVSADPTYGNFVTLSDKISYIFKATHISGIENFIRINLLNS